MVSTTTTVPPTDFLSVGSDGRLRCSWAVATPLEEQYHDSEWGRPVVDEAGLFERVALEAFQAGLSWRTVLEKRSALRRAFAYFAVDEVAAMTDDDLEQQLLNPAIIRNRAKVFAVRTNAHATIALRDHGGLSELIWAHRPATQHRPVTRSDIEAVTEESSALAKALKARGFTFVGPTTAYALMQAVGIVDDHIVGCEPRDSWELDQGS